MVIRVKETSPGTNIPEETYTIEDSGYAVEIPIIENPEINSSAQQRTEAEDKSPVAIRVAAMTKFDKILSFQHCNSMETKFCYFNNYNVNQSRHFCRNCQRYWTTGGTIKKLPIRAGHRKSKHASSYLRPVTTPSDKHAFGEPEKLLEATSIAYREKIRLVSSSCSSLGEDEAPHTLQGIPDPPYPWNLGWSDKEMAFPLNSPTMGMIPGVCIRNIAIPLVPSTSIDRLSPFSSARASDCSGNTFPSFRKHSRDLNLQAEERNEKGLCLPKTLRIVIDPVAAAKSSVWSTLGIKPGKSDPVQHGCMFRAFQFRPEANVETSEVVKALEANPVALSKSQIFRESN